MLACLGDDVCGAGTSRVTVSGVVSARERQGPGPAETKHRVVVQPQPRVNRRVDVVIMIRQERQEDTKQGDI